MTERLYYHDAHATEFDATVISIVPIPGTPTRRGVTLDRTAFYPTSGGQPFDTGTLGAARVVEVIDDDDGGVVHVVEGEVPVGPVHGRIDWSRRFEHMQQHTGQHVLSAAFDRLLHVGTVSFHLGSASSTIDLAREVTADEIARVEREANRVVWEDRPVTIRFADADEAARLPLRKESRREGTLRLVEVEDFDVSACGGTHVARTGAIGIIAVAGSEKFKGGTRLEFLCGERALSGFHALGDSVAASVRLLSVLPAELPSGIERLQTDARELRRQIKDLQTRLAGHEATGLARSWPCSTAGTRAGSRPSPRRSPPARGTWPFSSALPRPRRSSSRAHPTSLSTAARFSSRWRRRSEERAAVGRSLRRVGDYLGHQTKYCGPRAVCCSPPLESA
jgi:alanyl-tRNA synthetase